MISKCDILKCIFFAKKTKKICCIKSVFGIAAAIVVVV
jgi:hypothetical protein